jgi:hemoglobin
MQDPVSVIFAELKDEKPIFALVDEFYKGVENDVTLRPIYPADLTEPKKHLALFLVQRLGGRTTYSDERGHPRMRQRHMPFKIGMNERNAWLRCMFTAIENVPELAPHKQVLEHYFADFATFLINQPQ